MAVIEQHGRAVSDELVREHARDWEAFTRFLTYVTGAAIVILVLMAIFLL